MLKVPHGGNDHRQFMLDTVFNGILVPDGTPRLDECADARGVGDLDAVIERKERIGGQHGTLQVKGKLLGFFNGLSQ